MFNVYSKRGCDGYYNINIPIYSQKTKKKKNESLKQLYRILSNWYNILYVISNNSVIIIRILTFLCRFEIVPLLHRSV